MSAIDRFLARLHEPEVRDYFENLGLRAWFERDEGVKANPDPDEIEAAEEALQIKLPPSYRKLLLNSKPEEMPSALSQLGIRVGLWENPEKAAEIQIWNPTIKL